MVMVGMMLVTDIQYVLILDCEAIQTILMHIRCGSEVGSSQLPLPVSSMSVTTYQHDYQ